MLQLGEDLLPQIARSRPIRLHHFQPRTEVSEADNPVDLVDFLRDVDRAHFQAIQLANDLRELHLGRAAP